MIYRGGSGKPERVSPGGRISRSSDPLRKKRVTKDSMYKAGIKEGLRRALNACFCDMCESKISKLIEETK